MAFKISELFYLFLAGIFVLTKAESNDDRISVIQATEQIRASTQRITFGDFQICDWERVAFDDHIPLKIDGFPNGELDLQQDILIEGTLCDTNREVILALDADGLHGSIMHEDMSEVILSTFDSSQSSISRKTHQPIYDSSESKKMKAAEQRWREYMDEHRNKGTRRNMNFLEPGEIDIHVHLDIDKHMVDTFGDAFAAARYGVELLAVVNRDAYWNIGFNLKCVSVNVRTNSFVHNRADVEKYLEVLDRQQMPSNVHLMHGLTTRAIGGGLAWVAGLYWWDTPATGISGDLTGDFSFWDRYLLAHELGHQFGADHTHEMRPPVDRCGDEVCTGNDGGTLMSYCDACPGGLSNINYEFHPRVLDDIWGAFHMLGHRISAHSTCQQLSNPPDLGIPFYFLGNGCLKFDASNCEDCSVDVCEEDSIFSIHTADSRIHSGKDAEYCLSSSDCSRISLELCDEDSLSQRFNAFTHQICGQLTFDGISNMLSFAGEKPVQGWCSPDSHSVNDFNDRTCVDTLQNPIEISCGEVVNGNTASNCEYLTYFSLNAPAYSLIRVSTCGSRFDTLLAVRNSGRNTIASADDEGNFNTESSFPKKIGVIVFV